MQSQSVPNKKLLQFSCEGNTCLVQTGNELNGKMYRLDIVYHGVPRPAVNPPWDGGWIWKKDAKGRAWMTVACQGLGASVWFPCKDHQSDEPDEGASLTMVVPDTLVAVANGRLTNQSSGKGLASYTWQVENPINNYTIIPYIGKYVNFTDTLMGEKGKLDLSYWVLDYDLEKAKKQFTQVKPMLRAFEYWFGPYPFYEDSYKLVEAPHLGMEHQSAVAYGNKFMNGYMGGDLSGTGQGKWWDYIIVHESGHEWFANNITTNDIADMWVHEGFTDYSETLFIEYYKGKDSANVYLQGLRRNISNDKPIIGPYGVNQEGSGDMYFKGANMIHTIRQVINDEKTFPPDHAGTEYRFLPPDSYVSAN
jgi:aminopeptidase N